MLTYILVILIVLFSFLHVYFNHNEKARKIGLVPGPKGRFFFGNALDIMLSPVELFELGTKLANQHKNLFKLYAFNVSVVNIYNPEDIELITSTTKFNEKSFIYGFLKPWLGDGLLLSKGQKWHDRRKILTPTFHFNILKQFSAVMEETSRRMADAVHKVAGRPVDVLPIVSEYTLNTTCETSMGTRLQDESYEGISYKKSIRELVLLLYLRFCRCYLHTEFAFFFSPIKWKLRKHLNTIHKFTGRVINERKDYLKEHEISQDCSKIAVENEFLNSKRKKVAMLDLLIGAESEGLIDRAGIQEEVDTFMFEGHDTTASALAFTLMLLANNTACQERIVEELQYVLGDIDRAVTMDDLSKMKYMECCIKESLRLYPPVFFISRAIPEDVQLSNFVVPAETLCHIHIYQLHRRKDLFPNPEVFDPDRFLPENSIGRHPYAYVPFSAGARNCIGQKFAMLTMKYALAALLRRYKLTPVTRPQDLLLAADLVLRNEGPIEVQFEMRTQD